MSRTFLVILIGSLLSAPAFATTYVRVEKDGTKTYSDRPLPGGQPIDIQPAQTYSAPPTPSVDSSLPREQRELMEAANFHYQGCALSPRNDETFTNPQQVVVSLALTPSLRAGDRVSIMVDGAAGSGDDGTTILTLPQPVRGSHTVNAQVTDRSGKTVCQASTTFHVQRPTLSSPTRNPPRPTPH